MIVIFRSKAAADVIMFGDVAKRLLEIIGKEPDRGIITVEQLPAAIARLKAAIAEDKAARTGVREEEMPEFEAAEGGGRRPYVALAVRAVPLVELMEYSLKEETPVVWGV